MDILHKYKPTIMHQGEFYKILGRHNQNRVDKSRLGELVAYYGGDKVLGYEGKYLICETIKDAILVEN